MSTTAKLWMNTRNQFIGWSWLKKSLLTLSGLICLTSSFLFLTSPGLSIREILAETVITTQHRDWAWIFVGAQMRDDMIQNMWDQTDVMGAGHIDISKIKQHTARKVTRENRPLESLIKVEDISGQFWKGKKVYVYDPTTLRVVVPNKKGEGEKITSMVNRTGAVMGVNGGGFVDPDGLGNGFAPIGFIMSGGNLLYTDKDGGIPQHVVGFTDKGTLIVGTYTIDELEALHVKEAVSFYPRVIADGKPQITEGDGGWGRGPRTALGQKADGSLIFIIIDGRQTHSVGATLKEVQDLLLAEGAVNAGFLDGGASSELVVGSDLLTKPSSKYGERRLPSALLVFDHPEDYIADEIWAGVKTIDPGGAYDHPDFIKDMADQRAKQKANPKPTPVPTKNPEPTSSSAQNSTIIESTKPKESLVPETSKVPSPTPSSSASNNVGTATNKPGIGATSVPSSGITIIPTPGATTGPGAGVTTNPTPVPTINFIPTIPPTERPTTAPSHTPKATSDSNAASAPSA